MTAHRLAQLFQRALERPPEEREAFLEESCADDPALRAELRSLLDSHEAAPDFLDDLRKGVLAAAFGAAREAEPHPSPRGPAPGRTVGRYELIERLGGGGMGAVFKARDPALDRLVALKFLPAHLAADPEARERLRSEARAASALDHPNVAVVYEIGAARLEESDPEDGRLYIAMAHYEGETVDRRIARGPLPLVVAVDLASRLADGLAHAHERKIVHRDIKPANLLVTERGELKILDFGIARITGAHLAGEGACIGTPAYMSPEQTRGDPVDARSDVWAAGVVLYEMLAGVRPFGAGQEEAVVIGIRHDDPAPLDTLREDVPAVLARLVDRCLAKDPRARPADGAALAAELHGLCDDALQSTGVPGHDVPRASIVVIPFLNLTSDPENEFFSDGMTEEVIANLSRIRSLRVISRTSSMRLKGTERGIRSIAQDLGVEYALEGSVRKSGTAVRVTARLVDAGQDAQLWSATFDGTLEDVFDIQSEVSEAIADALRIRLSPRERQALSARPIADSHAYESYLRARYEAWRFSSDGLDRARRYILSALAIVGDNERLYATLGHITAMQIEMGAEADADALERVERLTHRVFAMNPDSPRGHWLDAFAAFHRGDLARAIRSGERALAIQPDESDILMLLGYVYAHAGRNADATALFERALAVDPLTPLTQGIQGFVPVMEGRFADAVEPYRRQAEMDPESPFAAVFHGWALAYDRRIGEAIEALERAATRFPGTAFGSYARSFALALGGEPRRAIEAITPAFETAARHSEMFARALAHCYALAGETDRALEWLEREIALGMLNYAYLAEHDWFLDGLRDHPRFAALLRRVRQRARELVAPAAEGDRRP